MQAVALSRAKYETRSVAEERVGTCFYLVWMKREHENREYVAMCEKMKESKNEDLQVLGELFLSLPSHRGITLCNHFLRVVKS